MNNQTKRNQLIFAYIGMTKSGKTTSMATFSENPGQMIDLSSGSKDGRTKVVVEYHFVTDEPNGIQIENIEYNYQAIMCSPDGQNVDKYNEELAENKILKGVLKLHPVAESEGLKENITRQLETLKGTKNTEDIKKLINTEGIDKYIKRITLRVKANEEVRTLLLEKDIDLYIRDTRGLLDIALEDNTDGTKKLVNVQSLKDLGLDGINGVTFFCNESYPEMISTIYEDTFKNVFQSVPFFLVARDHSMMKLFRSNQQPETFENISSMLENIQNKVAEAYQNVEEEYFIESLALLEKFSVVEKNNVGGYALKNTYFKQSQLEFLTSECTTLKKYSHGAIKLEDIPSDKDFKFYKKTMLFGLKKMVEKVLELHEGIDKLISSGCAVNIIRKEIPECMDELIEDFSRYDKPWQAYDASQIVKPQLKDLTQKKLQEKLVDKEEAILGKYKGISTLQNGKLKYPATAVSAVTSRRCIYNLIFKITLDNDLLDKNGEQLFPSIAGDYERQTALLKKILLYTFYQYFTDADVTIKTYLILNRTMVKNAIEQIRVNNVQVQEAFESCIYYILNDFCKELQNISSLSEIFTYNS